MLQKPACKQLSKRYSIESAIVIKSNFFTEGVSKKRGLRRKSSGVRWILRLSNIGIKDISLSHVFLVNLIHESNCTVICTV